MFRSFRDRVLPSDLAPTSTMAAENSPTSNIYKALLRSLPSALVLTLMASELAFFRVCC